MEMEMEERRMKLEMGMMRVKMEREEFRAIRQSQRRRMQIRRRSSIAACVPRMQHACS